MSMARDRTIETRIWCIVTAVVVLAVVQVATLNGPNVCMVQQKYNITKRVKYRAPMSIRTYEWCFSMPPRCSKWNTEMRDLTRLETEERTAEVAVCCPGYKMKDITCVPICPHGKTGHACSEDCPPNKWGPNCVHECPGCDHGTCSPTTGECRCEDGWQGESCSVSMPSTPLSTTMMEEILTTAKPTTKTLIETTTKATAPTPPIPVTEMGITTTTSLKPVSTTIQTISPTTVSSTIAIMNSTTTLSTVFTSKFTKPDLNIQKNDLLRIPINIAIDSDYNRTEIPFEISSDTESTKRNTTPTLNVKLQTNAHMNTSTAVVPTISTITTTTSLVKLTVNDTAMKTESTKKQETTLKVPTTKSKPKEIWIRPTQRGESSFIETKIRVNPEQSSNKYRSATKHEEASELTTPRTIIVSIIPTSVSYVTFKKLALTTASYMSQTTNVSSQQPQNPNNKSENGVTKKLSTQKMSTAMPFTIKVLYTVLSKNTSTSTTTSPLPHKHIVKSVISKLQETSLNTNKPYSAGNTTNSMPSTLKAANKKLSSPNILTTTSLTNNQTTQRLRIYETTPRPYKSTLSNRQTTTRRSTSRETTSTSPLTITSLRSKPMLTKVTRYNHNEETRNISFEPEAVTPKIKGVAAKTTKLLAIKHSQKTNDTKRNVTKVFNTKPNVITTAGPLEDETFHILTEPEHITAVMNDKGRDHSTIDLISVISIAGGVMMAVITVAVIIVMVERCKRPRYEDVRKINDIRMQVMIDNNDVPPPYVRSIFHTPLPDPPTSEKCHYQPISTLDRNLKQFMRPVVVQAISPIMLENFRGILECHYDHLPQRNYDCGTLSTRCSTTPSMACTEELRGERALSVTDYTIEAMKCEAKLDVIDNTTSEPLYAEIPCWRPPSEHAIEVLNLNGEAVTEL